MFWMMGPLTEIQVDRFDSRVVREGMLQRRKDRAVRCLTCNHRCLLHEQDVGVCGTRVNTEGSVKTLVYGNVSSLSNNPIEKKPFFHFAPGTKALTVGSWGCNASCPFCQNFDVSKGSPEPSTTRYLSPERFVAMAQERNSSGISISFNEAATLMLEWNTEAFREARDRGLYNTIVTNGYMTPKALDLLIDAGLDAANVDVKGCEPEVTEICGIRLQPVLDNVLRMFERGVHVELTTLVVPGLSDKMECLEHLGTWIVDSTNAKTPWHLNRYHPAYKYPAPITSRDLLREARDMAKSIGLQFVYVGNAGRAGFEDTVCPKCGTLCYERLGFISKNIATDTEGRCETCGYDLGIDMGYRP
ncbi:AmmeMemoRadiSam system radical SAM enzyme [Candidatus Thorarchaeota archaeon]|nr:MAG: AmmeMemoRadiSam system radical SAM enzyme [Candidatus Thorarchaeota archaeon]